MHKSKHGKWRAAGLLIMLVGAILLASCGGQPTPGPAHQTTGSSAATEVKLAPESVLIPQIAAQPPVVREAYRFAVANPDVLAKLPCFCGCGNMGHISNLDCFVQQINPDGSVVFGDHALG